jgi:hypothetical protein
METPIAELRRIVTSARNTWTDTGLPRVAMVCAEACPDQVYQPMLHLVLQGTKTLSIGEEVLRYTTPAAAQNVCFQAVRAPDEMLDAWVRMLRLVDRPHEAPVLAPMIEREILYRVLQGPLGGVLRDMARPDGRMTQIRRVTQWIGEHYTEPLRVEPLALMAEMSVAFYPSSIRNACACCGLAGCCCSIRWTPPPLPTGSATRAPRNSVASTRGCSACPRHGMPRGSGRLSPHQARSLRRTQPPDPSLNAGKIGDDRALDALRKPAAEHLRRGRKTWPSLTAQYPTCGFNCGQRGVGIAVHGFND